MHHARAAMFVRSRYTWMWNFSRPQSRIGGLSVTKGSAGSPSLKHTGAVGTLNLGDTEGPQSWCCSWIDMTIISLVSTWHMHVIHIFWLCKSKQQNASLGWCDVPSIILTYTRDMSFFYSTPYSFPEWGLHPTTETFSTWQIHIT